jgi:hypothetical protein
MIKRIALTFATAGLTALGFAGPMSTAAHASTPAHAPTAVHPQIRWPVDETFNLINENWSGDCARIDSSGLLIIGSGDCVNWEYGSSTDELIDENNGSNQGKCLYSTASAYDLGTCNASNDNDVWHASSTNNWSQVWTGYNFSQGESMWADGTGTSDPLYPGPQNGTSYYDHWEVS